MSDTQEMMILEFLPNEILIQCFKYFNAFDIFYSFHQLNHRFNDLIHSIPLCINLKEAVDKTVFDRFCKTMTRSPQIKDQVHSLSLPSSGYPEIENLQTKTFLSFFSLEEFQNLQRFKTNADVTPISKGTIPSYSNEGNTLNLCLESFPKLQTLSMSRLIHRSEDVENTILSITNLQVDICTMDDVSYFSKRAPMLKYLHIDSFACSSYSSNKNTKESWLYLERLIIDDIRLPSFNAFEVLLMLTPNLKSLSICDSRSNLINAAEWERLITTSLPRLNAFQFMFMFSCYKEQDMIIGKFQQFQTDFWQKQHSWLVEYGIMDDEALIYTIPFKPNMRVLERYYSSIYKFNFKTNVNTFVNVTKLRLDKEMLTSKYEAYFPNVTSLELRGDLKPLTIEQTERLVQIVNPFHIKHLDISHIRDMNIPFLLKLFEHMPQLSSLSIPWDTLAGCLNDGELCKYFKKLQRLHIKEDYFRKLNADLFQRNEFYEVFSNIKYLKLKNDRGEGLLFSLNRLSKLSTFETEWSSNKHPHSYLHQVEYEVKKLNAIYSTYVDQHEYEPPHYDRSWGTNCNLSGNYNSYDRHRREPKSIIYILKICVWLDNSMP